ncbi:hypothetical protein HDA32_003631 [Spinactinospora alkalitolerans]|uniref:Uncharacterized protein n=1 Tax=Spinactinospora alkalitolerans TaxID=687207 RepID=A0A852TXM8_9ACTN|nr:hypothetical protein [Spinactinospora alkalitolerans]NYE48511.1 hypothetical protein [Spinactinospora alkalitolerans]
MLKRDNSDMWRLARSAPALWGAGAALAAGGVAMAWSALYAEPLTIHLIEETILELVLAAALIGGALFCFGSAANVPRLLGRGRGWGRRLGWIPGVLALLFGGHLLLERGAYASAGSIGRFSSETGITFLGAVSIIMGLLFVWVWRSLVEVSDLHARESSVPAHRTRPRRRP